MISIHGEPHRNLAHRFRSFISSPIEMKLLVETQYEYMADVQEMCESSVPRPTKEAPVEPYVIVPDKNTGYDYYKQSMKYRTR